MQTIEIRYTGEALWARIERAVEKVKLRLRRVTKALNSAKIPSAVIGGNAVQHWVSQVDESVVRNTRDVDIIINPGDLDDAIKVLEKVSWKKCLGKSGLYLSTSSRRHGVFGWPRRKSP